MELFSEGIAQTLESILENKEVREAYKKKVLHSYPKQTLISITFNIPGSIKTNPQIERVFQLAITAFERYCRDNELKLIDTTCKLLATGPEYYAVIDSTREDIKNICIQFESFYQIGRLMDIDVYRLNAEEELVIIDRDQLDRTPRKCFICSNSAKACTRNKTHSIAELRQKINEMCQTI